MNSNGNVSVSEPNEKIIQNKHNDYDSKEEKIMPLVTSKEMLLKAQKGGYAVGAFNAENMEMVKAIIQAAAGNGERQHEQRRDQLFERAHSGLRGRRVLREASNESARTWNTSATDSDASL